MIAIDDKKQCAGCTACAEICPSHCIQMNPDEEGFLYPEVDSQKCIQCGACERVCPIHNPIPEQKKAQRAYLIQHHNDAIRLDSTSGGAFTAIASLILEHGGVVFGAAYEDGFAVHHTYVETAEELYRFRNSKYVQSELGNTFQQVRNFLKDDRWVCFSGTPCQIEGLVKFLGKNYEKLLLVDVVCRGVPSPVIWRKYLQYKQVDHLGLDNIRFRDKYYGYKYTTMSFIKNHQNIYHAGSQMDPMLRAFISGICGRPSCFDCRFKKRYRVSDITLWDCVAVDRYDPTMNDDKGTTRVLCHTEKGNKIIDQLGKYAKVKEIPADQAVSKVKEMVASVRENPRRAAFFQDAQRLDGAHLFEKYFPITLKVRLKTWIRKMLVLTNTYQLAKRCFNKLRGR